MPSKWSLQMNVKFVELYKERQCLWDQQHELYKNKQAREAALSEMVAEMDLEEFGVAEAKAKIKSLRSTYNIEVGKHLKSIQSGCDVYVPSLKWFHIMKQVMVKGTPDGPETSTMEKKEETNQESGSETEQQCFTRTKPEQDPLHIQPRKKQKHKNRSPSRYITNAIAKIEKLATRRETEFDVWAKSVAIQLNNMNSCRALRLQLQLQSVITEERLAHECEQDD